MKVISIALIAFLIGIPVVSGSGKKEGNGKKDAPKDEEKCSGSALKADLSDSVGPGNSGVEGIVTFSCPEDPDSEYTEIKYEIVGLTPGKHGLHVHQFPITSDCLSTGGHWNPENLNHGSNFDAQRHIGDLGNVLADENGNAEGTLLAIAPLTGPLGLMGRSVVVHVGEDDLGTGGNDGSRAVGNAGARPACGNIEKMWDI